jgi:hypothetical protein
MSLEENARELVALRNQVDELENRMDELRKHVYEDLLANNLTSYETEGFRITRTPEATVLSLSKQLLIDALKDRGMSQSEIDEILTEAQREGVRSGGLSMRRLRP